MAGPITIREASALTVTANATGNIDIRTATGNMNVGTATTNNAGDLTLFAGGALALGVNVTAGAAGTATLQAGGGITNGANTLVAGGGLTINNAASVDLNTDVGTLMRATSEPRWTSMKRPDP